MIPERITSEDLGIYGNQSGTVFGNCEFIRNPRADFALQAVMRCLMHRRLPGKALIVSGTDEGAIGPLELRISSGLNRQMLSEQGFVPIPKVERFFAQNQMCGGAMFNAELNSVCVTSPIVSVIAAHVVACAITALFPAFFVEMPLTELEKKLLKELADGTKDGFLLAFEMCVKELGIDKAIKATLIEKINAAQNTAAVSKYKKELRDVECRIAGCVSEIATLEEHRHDIQNAIIGASSRNIDYSSLLSDDNIIIEGFREDEGCINFGYVTKAWTVDPEIIENKSGYIYTDLCPADQVPLLQRLLYKVFVSKELTMWMSGAFQLQLLPIRITSRDYVVVNDRKYMPNPHIFNYSCIGGYRSAIDQACHDGNLEYAFELAKASAGNVNFADYTVMHLFIRDDILAAINGTECRCLEDKSGNKLTIREWWENEQRNSND